MSIKIKAPVTGKIVPIEDVPDIVFAQKMMGEGIAIEPSENGVYAPISGVLTTVFPTGHAYGITGENGEEVLVHIGVNTVELKGEGFDVKVETDQKVQVGDLLCVVDFESIRAKGIPTVTPIIITNTADYSTITKTTSDKVEVNDEILELVK